MSTYEYLVDHPRMPRVGQLIGDRYRILSIIGEGGFGAVYRARDTKTEAEVAIKVLDPRKSAEFDFAQRFQQEIKLTSQLRHHNTIKVWDAGETSTGCLFMTMELVTGEPLHQVIERSGKIPIKRTVHILGQVLKSLAEAHKLGIIHRDLKPSNIMLCQLEAEPDFVKVLDFGISKALSPDMASVKTQTGMFLGTPKYAAPEVLRGAAITPASDLYSLGLILYEMLTGEPAIKATGLVEILAIQCGEEPIGLPEQVEGTAIGRVLAKSLSKSLSQRYTSALEMLTDLRSAEETEPAVRMVVSKPGVSARDETLLYHRDTATTSLWERATRLVTTPGLRHRRNLIAVIGLAAAVLVIGTVAAIRMGREESQDTPTTGDGQVTASLPVQAETAEPPQAAITSPVGNAERVVAVSTEELEGAGAELPIPVGTGPDRSREAEPVAGTGGGEVPSQQPATGAFEKPPAVVHEPASGPTGEAGLVRSEVPPMPPQQEAGEQSAPAVPATTRLRVSSDPVSAEVWLDGVQLGETPFDQQVPVWSGAVRLEVRRRGYRSWREDIEPNQPELTYAVQLRPRSGEGGQSERPGREEEGGESAQSAAGPESPETRPTGEPDQTVPPGQTEDTYDPFGLIQNR